MLSIIFFCFFYSPSWMFLIKRFCADSQMFCHLAMIYYKLFPCIPCTTKNAHFRSTSSFPLHSTLEWGTKTFNQRSARTQTLQPWTKAIFTDFNPYYYFALRKPGIPANNNMAIAANNNMVHATKNEIGLSFVLLPRPNNWIWTIRQNRLASLMTNTQK